MGASKTEPSHTRAFALPRRRIASSSRGWDAARDARQCHARSLLLRDAGRARWVWGAFVPKKLGIREKRGRFRGLSNSRTSQLLLEVAARVRAKVLGGGGQGEGGAREHQLARASDEAQNPCQQTHTHNAAGRVGLPRGFARRAAALPHRAGVVSVEEGGRKEREHEAIHRL